MTKLWHDILELAIHTPSPHNTQPWRIQIRDTFRALIFIDRRKMVPVADPDGSFVFSSMTMFIESISLLAANRGYRLESEIVYRGMEVGLIPFAELNLVADNTVKGVYDDSLFLARRTSRFSYHRRPLELEDIAFFNQLVKSYGHEFGRITSSVAINEFLGLNIDALFHDMNRHDYQCEIAEYLRYSKRSAGRLRDGLEYRCMNMPGYEMWLLTTCPKILKIPIIRDICRMVYRKRLGHAETIAWLSGPYWSPENAFAAGPMLFRFWMEATKRGIYIQPFGNMVTNSQAAPKMATIMSTQNIWLVFKMGYSDVPPKSHRKPLQEVLLD